MWLRGYAYDSVAVWNCAVCMFTLVISADSCLSVYVQEMPVCLESTACQADMAQGDRKHFAIANGYLDLRVCELRKSIKACNVFNVIAHYS